MNTVEEIVAMFKEIRRQRGYSQSYVALAMGVDQGNFSRMEAGMHTPTLATLKTWAGALGHELVVNIL